MVGQKLKELRISKKLSQDDVSKATGITDSRLSKIERGVIAHPSLDDINAILKVYQVPLIAFLCDVGYCKSNANVFRNVEKLTEFEIEHVQAEIDFIIKEKEM